MIIKKWIKIAILAVEVLLIVLLITFGVISTKRGKTIRAKDIRIEQLMNERTELLNNIEKMGAESVLSVTCNINIKSTNVMGVNTINSNNLAKEISQMTRKELYDSLYGPKREVYDIDTTDGIITRVRKKQIYGCIRYFQKRE